VAHLRLLMDEVFGPTNSLGTLVWKRRSSSAMRGTPLSVDHEYVLAYAYSLSSAVLYGLAKSADDYPYQDERGRYASTDLTVGMGRDARPGQFYPITNPRTGKVYQPNPERVWRFFPETMQQVIAEGLIIWPDEREGQMERPRFKTYYDPNTDKPKPVSSWIETLGTHDRQVMDDEREFDIAVLRSGMTQEGGKLLQQMMGTKLFTYPKPLSLIRSLVRAATKADDVVLDSFAGTGTTGHAVLDLNHQDDGHRRFILVEMEADISARITRERLRRAVAGYTFEKPKGGSSVVPGLGGGFRYCLLGEALFDEAGNIHDTVTFTDLGAHVFFTETGSPILAPATRETPLLGIHDGKAVYLLFNGVMGDKRPNGGNVLTREVLRSLPDHPDGAGPRVIYGEGCRLGATRLKREGIVFKQIPYEIRIS
jgi:adenine-specific DNA-methyltransferase